MLRQLTKEFMNKAAFLNIVRQVAPIKDQEVEDLEKLVVSFPYCQTAHVLLAKAAYDRGSMLSTQKLRRAAAHVSNRALLKRIVYTPAPVHELVVVEEELSEPTPAETYAVLEPNSEKQSQNVQSLFIETQEPTIALLEKSTAEPEPEPASTETVSVEVIEETETFEAEVVELVETEPELPVAALPAIAETEVESEIKNPAVVDSDESFDDLLQVSLPASPIATVAAAFSIDTEPSVEHTQDIAEHAESEEETTAPAAIVTEPAQPTDCSVGDEAIESEFKVESSQEEQELIDLIQIDSLATYSAPIPAVDLTHAEIVSEILSATEAANAEEPEPLSFTAENTVAEAVQTDDTSLATEDYVVAAGETEALDSIEYQFPMMQTLGTQTDSETAAPDDPYLALFAQNNLAYWMNSSRLGESIQLKDDLTSATPYHFQPELILEHVKNNGSPASEKEQPQVAKLDIQLDIINQFLKNTPRRKTLANVQQNNAPQEDLSAKSSKIKKNLASENLAHIFIKQGKIKKAVKIYEQLIVKFPEKKSYFAQQIEKLRNEP
ncbi:hypothetical protein [Rufibacter roseus]